MLFRRAGKRVFLTQRSQFSTASVMETMVAKGSKLGPAAVIVSIVGLKMLFKSPEVPAVQRAGGHGDSQGHH